MKLDSLPSLRCLRVASRWASRTALRLSLLAMVALAFTGSPALGFQERQGNSAAQRDGQGKPEAQTPRQRAAQRQPTPQEERRVLAFVKEHHAELTELLVYLKENEQRQYTAAIRELLRTQERLNMLAKRDEVRYGLELENWKLESRSRLLAAKILMKDRPALRKELHGLLAEQLKVKQQLLELEQQRVSDRLDRIQEQVERLNQNSEAEIERLTRALLKDKSSGRPEDAAPRGARGPRADGSRAGGGAAQDNRDGKMRP